MHSIKNIPLEGLFANDNRSIKEFCKYFRQPMNDFECQEKEATDAIIRLWERGELSDQEADQRQLDCHNRLRGDFRAWCGLAREPQYEP